MSVDAIQTVQHELSREAFRKALLADSWERLRVYRRLFGAVTASLVAGVVVLSFSAESREFALALARLWLPIVLFIGLWPVALALLSAFRVTLDRASRADFGEQSCSVFNDRLVVAPVSGPAIEVSLDQVLRCSESETHIVIYYGPWSGEVIPRQAIAPSDEAELKRRLTRARSRQQTAGRS